MPNGQITRSHYEALRKRFGNHSKAARHLGINPSYYRYVRRTGKMSSGLARLIEIESQRQDHA